MSFSMYAFTVPVFVHGLQNLAAILTKAEAYAAARKIDPSVLINARLAPDMYPLSRQVQIACDMAKGAAARLSGGEVPSFPDTETTFAELQERIRKTIAFIQTVTAAQIDGSEKRKVTLKIAGQETTLDGDVYLQKFVIPNFYFHLSIAYALLRHNGMDLGKRDFMGAVA